MAETFLYSIAGKILGELSSPALQRIGLFWGFKTDLKKLEESVSTIKAVLLDAEEKKTTNHKVRDWLKKLEAAIYDADDVIDDLSTQFKRHRVGAQMARGGVFRSQRCALPGKAGIYDFPAIDDFSEIYAADNVIDDLSAIYDADDVSSLSSTKSETGSNRFAFRYKMGRKVKEIRERLDDIAADRIKFHFRERLDDDETRVENKKREETHSFVPSNI